MGRVDEDVFIAGSRSTCRLAGRVVWYTEGEKGTLTTDCRQNATRKHPLSSLQLRITSD